MSQLSPQSKACSPESNNTPSFQTSMPLIKEGRQSRVPRYIDLDQANNPTHPHNQVGNALAPLRLCERFSGSGW